MVDLLVLDDDAGVRENLTEYLEDEGYECTSAVTGSRGLELLESHSEIRIAIVDLRLPDMDGIHFIECAKRINEKLHCLIHTGSVEFEADDRLLKLGVSSKDLFYKPIVNLTPLVLRLEQALSI